MTAKRHVSQFCAVLCGVAALALAAPAFAQGGVVAKVNGKAITESDMKLAESEIGTELGNLPEATKRRVLVEYLIEHVLFADAAEAQKLDKGSVFDERLQYWRRRALRETYFDSKIKGAVSEADAKSFYDSQISQVKPQEEVKARHILVESQDKAKEIAEKIAHGADFAQMAKENSKDPGSKDEGGELGFFSRGQMVPQFEEAAFKLATGDISQPVETQFGWHLIKVDERRERKPPSFDQVKDRIVGSLVHRKAQEVTTELRGKAAVEYVDADIRKQVDAEQAAAKTPAGAAPKQ